METPSSSIIAVSRKINSPIVFQSDYYWGYYQNRPKEVVAITNESEIQSKSGTFSRLSKLCFDSNDELFLKEYSYQITSLIAPNQNLITSDYETISKHLTMDYCLVENIQISSVTNGSTSDESISTLCKALEKNSSVVSLGLNNTLSTEKAFQSLNECLCVNTFIKVLSISRSIIDTRNSGEFLKEIISENKSLVSIYMSNCKMSKECYVLLESIQRNNSATTLSISPSPSPSPSSLSQTKTTKITTTKHSDIDSKETNSENDIAFENTKEGLYQHLVNYVLFDWEKVTILSTLPISKELLSANKKFYTFIEFSVLPFRTTYEEFKELCLHYIIEFKSLKKKYVEDVISCQIFRSLLYKMQEDFLQKSFQMYEEKSKLGGGQIVNAIKPHEIFSFINLKCKNLLDSTNEKNTKK